MLLINCPYCREARPEIATSIGHVDRGDRVYAEGFGENVRRHRDYAAQSRVGMDSGVDERNRRTVAVTD